MGGKAQVTDAAVALLLLEIFHNAQVGIQIPLHRFFVHVVQKVEVEILHIAPAQLLFKQSLGIVAFQDHMSGELIRQVVRLSGVMAEYLAHHPLGHTTVVWISSIEVIDTVLNAVADHLFYQFLVDLTVLYRQTHCAKAQQGQLLILKFAKDHTFRLISMDYGSIVSKFREDCNQKRKKLYLARSR